MLHRRAFLLLASSVMATSYATSQAPAWAAGVKKTGVDEFSDLDAVGLAALVKKGEVSPLELVDLVIRRIDALNPILNAIVYKNYDRAREQAKLKPGQGAFAGVPYLYKNLGRHTGLPATSSSRAFADVIAPAQGLRDDKLDAMGGIIVGLTNAPEFGLLATTEPLLFGPTHNPWNLSYSPGGSSGGSAAAVAAGIVPMATADDGGGSIRMPAANCGVLGLKSTRAREIDGDDDFLVVHGCVSRSVRDTATFLAEIEDPQPVGMKPVGFISGPSKKRLKIAFSTRDQRGQEPHPEVAKATRHTAKLLQDLGHTVEEAWFETDGDALYEHFLTLWSLGAAQVVSFVHSKIGKTPDETHFEPWLLGLAQMFHEKRRYDAIERAYKYFRVLHQQMRRFFQNYDAYLTPVLSTPPVLTGEQAPTVAFETLMDRVTRYVTYTPLANVTGVPAMSVPLYWTEQNLPVGSQLMADIGQERVLLELAYELEHAQPWAKRWPSTSIKSV